MSDRAKKVKLPYLRMAFRNLGRHKVKTIITCLAIAVGVMAYLYIDGMLYGINIDSKRNMINYETGAAKIYSEEYYEDKDSLPLYKGFYDYEEIIEKLNSKGYSAAPHAVFSGTLRSKKAELPFMFIAIQPELEKDVLFTADHLEKGRMPEPGKFEIVLGARSASKLNVDVGSPIKMSTIVDVENFDGTIQHVYQAPEFTVVGIVNTPNPRVNSSIAYVHLETMQDEQGIMLYGLVTEIVIRKEGAKDYNLPVPSEEPAEIRKALGDTLSDDLKLVSWREDAKEFLTIMESKNKFSKILVIVLIIIAVIGVANTMLMAVLERTKEIGMLRAMGMTGPGITRLFMSEAILIGVLGTLIGLILGTLINIPMVTVGIDYTEMINQTGDMGFRITGIFKSGWNPQAYLISILLMPLVSGITALGPCRRATKKSITDALRFE